MIHDTQVVQMAYIRGTIEYEWKHFPQNHRCFVCLGGDDREFRATVLMSCLSALLLGCFLWYTPTRTCRPK